MTNKREDSRKPSKGQAEELKEQELDEVTAGSGGQQLLAHELTHIQQQKSSSYIGETEKNLTNVSGAKLSGDKS